MKLSSRKISLVFLGFFFISVGLLHFINPSPFAAIVPPYLPCALTLVYLSGFFEILGGAGLAWPRYRSLAGLGLVILLLAVFPANIYMLTDHPYLAETRVPEWSLWLRLPLQFLLMTWVWWASRPMPPEPLP